MNPTTEISRRAFIEKAATISAIGFAAPRLMSANAPKPARTPSPNERIHVGLIGCGGMGQSSLRTCASQPDRALV